MKTTLSVRTWSRFIHLTLFIAICLLPFKSIHAQDTKDYKFKIGINYNVTSNDKSHDLMMWLSDAAYTGMEVHEGGNGVFIIFNMQDKKMMTVMDAQKMVMIMDLGKYQQMASEQANGSGDDKEKTTAQIVKTGVTEKILGYNCTQYKITSDKTETLVWVTTELGSGFTSFSKSLMMAMNGGKGKPQGNVPNLQGITDGVTLKMEATELSTKKVTKLEATSINKDGKEINISDYKVMSM